MAKEGHEGPGGDPLFNAVDTERVAKHVRGDWLSDSGLVGHLLDKPLDGPGGHTGAIVLGKAVLNEPPDPIGHG